MTSHANQEYPINTSKTWLNKMKISNGKLKDWILYWVQVSSYLCLNCDKWEVEKCQLATSVRKNTISPCLTLSRPEGSGGGKCPRLLWTLITFFKIQPNAANFTSFSKIYLGLNWDRLFFLELGDVILTDVFFQICNFCVSINENKL